MKRIANITDSSSVVSNGVETETDCLYLSRPLRISDFTLGETEQAFLSHWVQTVGTPFAKSYEAEASRLLPIPVFEYFARRGAVCESAQQTFFPDLLESPFPPPHEVRFTFIDLFAGIGGFRLAMQRCGGKCVFSSEWDEAAQKTYFANYGEYPFGDITKAETKECIPQGFDVLCAGFPCQPFSISGKMRGFNDTRGTLFFDVCEVIKRHHPKIVFLENVKHLVHHDHGNTLRTILHNLSELGYNVSWKLLNASDFGVAQNRERIIIVASRVGSFDFDKLERQPRKALCTILDSYGSFDYLDPSAYTLLEETKEQASGLIFAGYRNKSLRKAGVRPGTEQLSRVHKQPNRIYSVKGLHPTLPSQEASGRFFILTDDNRVRKLTIKECYKLMGFPESFALSPSAASQYKQIGNAVCVPMIEAIARTFFSTGLL